MKALVVIALGALATPAFAQPNTVASDIEVPSVVIDTEGTSGPSADEALDLANIVQSAAKGVTTVQEAPAIVTVITADDIKDRQITDILQITDAVPGWFRIGTYYSQFNGPIVRGQNGALQFLTDGISMFDPYINSANVDRVQPVELIKRIEIITGPGGVLWGSNSLLGILNIITKDADDVDGVELGGGLGNGPGDLDYAKAYVLAGKNDLLGGKLKVFAHGSVETFRDPQQKMPIAILQQSLPQPNAPSTYGPLTEADNRDRSLVVNLDGKVTYDKFQFRVNFPITREAKQLGFSGEPVRSATDPNDPMNLSHHNNTDSYDRYAVLEYRTRFAKDKAGITAHTYLIDFVRKFDPLQYLAPSQLVPGGFSFKADMSSWRGGGALDGDVELAKNVRLLYGAEAFHEWKPNTVTRSLQGDGTESNAPSPDPAKLPVLCPREYSGATMSLMPLAGCPLTFSFAADRTVMGAYVNPRWQATKTVTLDAGVRVQVAPEALGNLHYDPNLTESATAVWNFLPNWHLKLNYATGFRPPVFNSTVSNGEGIQIAGSPDLKVETSQAAQAEINARIFKGDHRIRELSFRADGSYTYMDNLIQITSGFYKNSTPRAVYSGELLGKLYIQGGHRFELGYTYMEVTSEDKGFIRSMPEHWFNFTTIWNLITNKLTASTNVRVMGAAEDPNRILEVRGLQAGQTYTALATDLVMDRTPPVAEVGLGATYMPTPKLAIRATMRNALFQHPYQVDGFFDYQPHTEYLPNPDLGFRAYLIASYTY